MTMFAWWKNEDGLNTPTGEIERVETVSDETDPAKASANNWFHWLVATGALALCVFLFYRFVVDDGRFYIVAVVAANFQLQQMARWSGRLRERLLLSLLVTGTGAVLGGLSVSFVPTFIVTACFWWFLRQREEKRKRKHELERLAE
jgi:hypothetical protein